MAKAPDAFRTISEVAEWLDVPTHVLRFWESRFTQVKPVKRAGGRRYYRPADMELLGGIKRLLHDEGVTIRGVQKLLREEGVRHVSALSPPLNGEDDGIAAGAKVISLTPIRERASEPPSETWSYADGADQAVDALAADYLDTAMPRNDMAMQSADHLPSDPSEEPPALPEDPVTLPEPAAQAAAEPEASETVPSEVPLQQDIADIPARSPFRSIPLPDEATVPVPHLLIATLAGMGGAGRKRKAQVLNPIVTEAEVLSHAWDARG